MTDTYQIPFYNRIARRMLRFLFRNLFHVLGDVELHGFENIPEDQAYLIAINHISLLEVPFVAAFWPTSVEMIGAADLWTRPGQSIIVRLYRGIRVDREQFDREVFRIAEDVLSSNSPLLIAPEGGRSHTPGMKRAKPGISYIVDRTGVPVLPVGILGSTEDFLPRAFRGENPPLQMRVGEAFHLPPIEGRGAERRQKRQQHADLIMARIASLLPEMYHGVYQNYQQILAGENAAVLEDESDLPA